ncbi:DUF883 family protein [Undibacterium oligocarboniphilum]|uniref:DUF883 domain-containing protein n=1 Tax=Undibacterium oligocarboniphilum TaxID=666702 RepID=A0A850QDT6_9BURK|nr:DUF883 family protein [Undibacterium oligocarboniphilum]MBC3869862.1 DUF883 domain-containing protein [Undibacterium oligocarboniphilum]NVO77478.1 DUF883 domain-containing protein [Undibacterium oligocarboniphilum]
MSSVEQHKDQLMHDLNQVIRDAEELLKNTEQQSGEGFKSAKARFEHTLKNAKAEVERIEDVVVTRTKEAAKATDVYVKENPWQSAGIAAGVGLLLGLLIGRSK